MHVQRKKIYEILQICSRSYITLAIFGSQSEKGNAYVCRVNALLSTEQLTSKQTTIEKGNIKVSAKLKKINQSKRFYVYLKIRTMLLAKYHCLKMWIGKAISLFQ